MEHPFLNPLKHHVGSGPTLAVEAIPDALVAEHAPALIQRSMRALYEVLVSSARPDTKAKVLDHVYEALFVASFEHGGVAEIAISETLEMTSPPTENSIPDLEIRGDLLSETHLGRRVLSGKTKKTLNEGDRFLFEHRAKVVDRVSQESPFRIVSMVYAHLGQVFDRVAEEEEVALRGATENESQRGSLTRGTGAIQARALAARATLIRSLVLALMTYHAGLASSLPLHLGEAAMSKMEEDLVLTPLLESPFASSRSGMMVMAADLDAHFSTSAFTLALETGRTKSTTEAVLRSMEAQRCREVGGLWYAGACHEEDRGLRAHRVKAYDCRADHHVWLSSEKACLHKTVEGAAGFCKTEGGRWIPGTGCLA